jgi:hypothetical protein
MLRSVFALCAGLFAAMIAITGMELVNAKWLYPPPPGADFRDPAQLQAFVAAMPSSALAMVVAGWLLGALAGGVVAARLETRHPLVPAGLVGAFIAIGTLLNAQAVPHPAWVVAAGTVLPIPLALLAAGLVRRVWPAPGR